MPFINILNPLAWFGVLVALVFVIGIVILVVLYVLIMIVLNIIISSILGSNIEGFATRNYAKEGFKELFTKLKKSFAVINNIHVPIKKEPKIDTYIKGSFV